MENVRFIYMKNKYQIKITEKIITINNLLNKFASILNIEIKQLYFIFKGKHLSINNNKRIDEITDNNLIIIFVFNLKIKNKNNNQIKELKNIICPECNNLSIINNNNDLFSLNNCINKHKFSDYNINLFLKSQYIDETAIKCDICKNYKYFYNKFYIASKGKKICPLCAEIYKSQFYILLQRL